MNRLEELGVFAGADEHHTKSDRGFIEAGDFSVRAEALLDQLRPVVMQAVIPDLEAHFGRWNPGGFMVFPLGMHDLGSVHLHVWPEDAPRQTDEGPSIHSHAWHLSSLVLKGTYRDSLYDLEAVLDDFTEAPEDEPLPRLYRSQFQPDGRDVLVTDGSRVRPIVRQERILRAGEKHFIPMGVPHLPQIPAEQTTATLVIDSQAFADTTDVVLYPHMEQPGNQVARARVLVDHASAIAVKRLLLA